MQRYQRKGSILVVLLLLLPVIILMVGFSIDIAHMQRVRTELRSATDLAAKAASDALSRTNDESTARQVAIEVAAANSVNGQPLTVSASNVVFGRSTKQSDGSWDFASGVFPRNAVQVLGSRTQNSSDGSVFTYFGQLYGFNEFQPEFQSTAAFIDIDICVVLDRSNSMKLAANSSSTGGVPSSDARYCSPPYSDSRWAALDAAMQNFVIELQANSAVEQVGMVTFASNFTSGCGETNVVVSIDQDLTTNLNSITAAMANWSSLVWNGRTDIKAGVEIGHQVLTGNLARANADKVMIVFTDGQYTEDNPVPAGVLAQTDGIVINTITFSPGANQSSMQELASVGNGRHFHADSATDLDEIFRELAASLSVIVK